MMVVFFWKNMSRYQNVKDAPDGRDLFVNLLMDVCVILIGKLSYTIFWRGNITYGYATSG